MTQANELVCEWCGKSYDYHLDFRASDAPVPRVPCLLLKEGFLEKRSIGTEDDFRVDDDDRDRARRALDRWIDEAERAAKYAHEDGRSGYVGRIKICAFVNDTGIDLRVERSFTEGL